MLQHTTGVYAYPVALNRYAELTRRVGYLEAGAAMPILLCRSSKIAVLKVSDVELQAQIFTGDSDMITGMIKSFLLWTLLLKGKYTSLHLTGYLLLKTNNT